MKKVFTSAYEVIHLFAQQTQEEAKSSNVFFYNQKIYSYGYHYLLGKFIDSNTIIINNEGYSNTTSKHISILTSASSQYKQYFTKDIDVNLVLSSVRENSKKIINAKNKQKYADEIINKFNSLTEYLKKYKKNNDLKSKGYKEIKCIYANVTNNLDNYINQSKKAQQKAKETQKKNELKQIKLFESYKISWLKLDKDILRISTDKTKIETSQGVKIEYVEALILANSILNNMNIVGKTIGRYTINEQTNKVLKIGCHTFDMQYLKNFSSKLINL